MTNRLPSHVFKSEPTILPTGHEQKYEPTVLLQVSEQPPLATLHSLSSLL